MRFRPIHDSDGADPAGALWPVSGADEEGDDLRNLVRPAFDREVVDLSAPAPVGIEQLTVEDAQRDVDLGAHPCPAFVTMRRGRAAIEMSPITTR